MHLGPIFDHRCLQTLTLTVMAWAGTSYGLGLFLQDVPRPPEVIVRDSLLRLWILEFTYAYSLGFAKFSILALYWNVFGLFKIRIPIIVLLVATVIWLLCRVCISSKLAPITFMLLLALLFLL